MAFKGPLKIGTTVEAKLLLDHTASGPAFLLMGYGRRGGTPSGEGDTASPGGTARADLALDARGRLEVGVDMSLEADTGVLIVSTDGEEKVRLNIQGDTVWAFSVVSGRKGGS
jgi:hypothetical protein